MRGLLLVLFFWSSVLCAAPALRLEPTQQSWVLDRHLELLTDPSHQISFEEVAQGQREHQFVDNLGGPPSPGFTKDFYWLRFKLVNGFGGPRRFLLVFEEMAVDFFEVYLPHQGTYVKYPGGDFVPLSKRVYEDRKFVYDVDLAAGQEATLYLHMQNGYAVMPLRLYLPSAYQVAAGHENLFNGIILGVILALAIYNLVLFFGIRDSTYASYGLYHFSAALLQSLLNGNAQQYLWPENPWLANHMMPIGIYLLLVFAWLFTSQFLGLPERQPRLHRVQRLGFGFSILMALASLWMSVNLSVPIAITTILFMAGTFVWALVGALMSRLREARFLALAWSVLLLGGVIYAARSIGLLPINWFTDNAMHLGMVMEALLLSWALSDRIAILRHDKARADADALAAQHRLTDALEAEVSARTVELQEKNNDLIQANNTKDQFFSILAHDLRGPIGSLAVIFNEVIGDPEDLSDELMQHIRSATGNLHQLLEDLLTWALSQKGQLESRPTDFYLQQLTQEAIALHSTQASQKQITLNLQVPVGMVGFADPSMIRTVVRNLLGNAIKFTPQGGLITLSARQEVGQLMVEVVDTGVGIPPEGLEKLFLLGLRLSSPGTQNESGTGLGLILCKEFIEKNSGQIGADSQLGQGSRFWFTLPQGRGQVAPQEPVHYAGQRALLAEDNALHVQTSRMVLEDLGFFVEVVGNGQEAVARVAQGGIDLVLMDIDMPVKNGLEATREIQRGKPSPPVISLSSYSRAELAERTEEQRFEAFLNKPLSREALLDALRSLRSKA